MSLRGWTFTFSCFRDRCLFDITAFRNVEWRNLLLTVSLGFTHPLGPIISALRAPSLASSSKASAASLNRYLYFVIAIAQQKIKSYFCDFFLPRYFCVYKFLFIILFIIYIQCRCRQYNFFTVKWPHLLASQESDSLEKLKYNSVHANFKTFITIQIKFIFL